MRFFTAFGLPSHFVGVSFILPNYLQLGMHVSATVAGLFMFPGAVIGSVLAPISGRLLDRVGATKLMDGSDCNNRFVPMA